MSTSSPRTPPLAATAATGGSGAARHPPTSPPTRATARGAMANCLGETHLDLAAKGKVWDVYESGEHLVLVATDRQSSFDSVLASIPFKGQVLNETNLWWFNRTRHITPNAVVSAPDKKVTIAKSEGIFSTGSTDTSLWTVYSKGVRNYCGNVLPDGMVKNQKLSANIIHRQLKQHIMMSLSLLMSDEIVKSQG